MAAPLPRDSLSREQDLKSKSLDIPVQGVMRGSNPCGFRPGPAGSDSINWRRPGLEFLMRRVVYTCLFGHSELFNDFEYERDGIDFICFTDDPELRSDFWKIELLPRKALDPARAAKKIKSLPHIYLAQYDHSLYIDNTVRLKAVAEADVRGISCAGEISAGVLPASRARLRL